MVDHWKSYTICFNTQKCSDPNRSHVSKNFSQIDIRRIDNWVWIDWHNKRADRPEVPLHSHKLNAPSLLPQVVDKVPVYICHYRLSCIHVDTCRPAAWSSVLDKVCICSYYRRENLLIVKLRSINIIKLSSSLLDIDNCKPTVDV